MNRGYLCLLLLLMQCFALFAQLPFRIGVKGFDGSDQVEQLLPSINYKGQSLVLGYGERNITLWELKTLNPVNSFYILGNGIYRKVVPARRLGTRSNLEYGNRIALGLLCDPEPIDSLYSTLLFSIDPKGFPKDEARLNTPGELVDIAPSRYGSWMISHNRIYLQEFGDTFHRWWEQPIQYSNLLENVSSESWEDERIAVTTDFKSYTRLTFFTLKRDSMQLIKEGSMRFPRFITSLSYSEDRKLLAVGCKDGSAWVIDPKTYRRKKVARSKQRLDPVTQLDFGGKNDKFLFLNTEYHGLFRARRYALPGITRKKPVERWCSSFVTSSGGREILAFDNGKIGFLRVGNKKDRIRLKIRTVGMNYYNSGNVALSGNGQYLRVWDNFLDLTTGISPDLPIGYDEREAGRGFIDREGRYIFKKTELKTRDSSYILYLWDTRNQQNHNVFDLPDSFKYDRFNWHAVTASGDTFGKVNKFGGLVGWEIRGSDGYYSFVPDHVTNADIAHADYYAPNRWVALSLNKFHLCDLKTGKVIFSKEFEYRESQYGLRLNPHIRVLNDSLLLISHRQFYDSAEIYNFRQDRFIKTPIEIPVSDALRLPGDTVLVLALANGRMVWVDRNGQVIRQKDVASSLFHIAYDPAMRRWYLETETHEISCRDEELNRVLYTVYPTENTATYDMGWILSDGNYYMCNPEHAHYIYNISNDENRGTVATREYEVLQNRPDRILAAVGKSSPEYQHVLRQLWLQRLKNQGVDSATLVSRLLSEQKKRVGPGVYSIGTRTLSEGEVYLPRELHFPKITRQRRTKLNVLYHYHNGFYPSISRNGNRLLSKNLGRGKISRQYHPVWDTSGDASAWNLEVTHHVPLVPGLNRFQITVQDDSLLKSDPLEEWVYCTNERVKKPELYLFTAGVSKYADSSNNLEYASRDAAAIADFYRKYNKKLGYKKVHVRSIKDGEVTDLQSAVKAHFSRAKKDDIAMLFVAGHGMLDSNLKFWFAPHDMDFQDPAAHGVAYHDLESAVDGCLAEKKLILLDACHSGSVITLESDGGGRDSASKITGRRGAAVEEDYFSERKLVSAGSLMDQVLGSFQLNHGTTVIAAADGTGYAYETPTLKHGLFTYCLLEVLHDNPRISVFDLQQILNKKVKELSGSQQQIRINSFNPECDWNLAP